MGYKPLNMSSDYIGSDNKLKGVNDSCTDCDTRYDFSKSGMKEDIDWKFSGTTADNGYRILVNQSNDDFEPVTFNERRFHLDSILISNPAINYGWDSVGAATQANQAQIALVLKRSEYWLIINIPVEVGGTVDDPFFQDINESQNAPTIDGQHINALLSNKNFCKSNVSSAFGNLNVVQLFLNTAAMKKVTSDTMDRIIGKDENGENNKAKIEEWIKNLYKNENTIDAPVISTAGSDRSLNPRVAKERRKLVCRPITTETTYIEKENKFSMKNPVVQGVAGVLLSVIIIILFKKFVK